MERPRRTKTDHVNGDKPSQPSHGREVPVDEDDALDALLSRPGEDEAPVHPFDRITDQPPPDAASARVVSEQEREAYWSALSDHPWAFDFFAAVRRLEALYPELPGFGASNRAAEDTIRFCQHPSLSFAPCTVSELRAQSSTAPTRMFVNFMGMFGPNGPLPLHLTEHAHTRELHHKDFTFSRFLDVFSNRMVGLFYRAWAASQMTASFDRTPVAALRGDIDYHDRSRVLSSEKDRYPVYVGSLFGLGMESTRHRDAVPDNAKLFFAGRLSGQQNGPEGLRSILAAYFQVPVRIEEFAGRWLPLPEQYFTCLGGARDPFAQHAAEKAAGARLGSKSDGAAVCGRHVWDCQGKFRIFLGPMGLDDFVKFVPGSASERRLRAWVRNYSGDEFAWDAIIILRQAEVPRTQLRSRKNATEIGSRLGWTTWTRTQAETRDRPDLVVRGE